MDDQAIILEFLIRCEKIETRLYLAAIYSI